MLEAAGRMFALFVSMRPQAPYFATIRVAFRFLTFGICLFPRLEGGAPTCVDMR